MALNKTYRQYLAGRLEAPQPYLPCIDDDIEVGISYYRKFTADKPHMHPVAMEHGYILSGKLRLMLLDGTHETFEFGKGDFFVIPTGTAYAVKNAPRTKVLFIKSPGGNDKQLVEVTPEVQEWLSKW